MRDLIVGLMAVVLDFRLRGVQEKSVRIHVSQGASPIPVTMGITF